MCSQVSSNHPRNFLAVRPFDKKSADLELPPIGIGVGMKSRHEMFHHPGSCRSCPKKEHAHARYPTIHHRAHLATALGVTAAKANRSPFGLPPASHTGSGGLREAGSGYGVRLRLREDRRRVAFGDHAAEEARRVDRGRLDGSARRDGARIIRPDHRPRTLRGSRRRLHYQSSLW